MHADLHNYIRALHNAAYPVICRRCTCVHVPFRREISSRSYVLAVDAYLTTCEGSHEGEGRPLVNHEGPRVQFYEAFSDLPRPNAIDLCLREILILYRIRIPRIAAELQREKQVHKIFMTEKKSTKIMCCKLRHYKFNSIMREIFFPTEDR